MKRSLQQLRRDALAIWHAGVDAVRSEPLVRQNVHVEGRWLCIGGEQLDLEAVGRIVVVGTGKAGAGMAAGLEAALGETLMAEKQLAGWINVPADCVRQLKRVKLHAARPAGVNEPTSAGVAGAAKILQLVASLTPRDLCLCLISGGGSALLPAPVEGITLDDKQAVTRHLSGAGADIRQLNTVRKQLSRIKGGGLARASRAGRLISLIVSDVIGDPLDVIASGPTVKDPSTPREALEILQEFNARDAGISPAVFDYLEKRRLESCSNTTELTPDPFSRTVNVLLGNNAVAVDAAGVEAERRGYSHAMTAAATLEGAAEDIGRHLADMAARMRDTAGPDCLITGGEPTVSLVDSTERGLGGRNQQLVLAALERLAQRDPGRPAKPVEPRIHPSISGPPEDTRHGLDGMVLLSGGTDGEDGPTDAAGAIVDASTLAAMREQGLSPSDYLRRNDAYHFFQPLGALIKTGPTHTNVCDLRVVVVDRIERASSAPKARREGSTPP